MNFCFSELIEYLSEPRILIPKILLYATNHNACFYRKLKDCMILALAISSLLSKGGDKICAQITVI